MNSKTLITILLQRITAFVIFGVFISGCFNTLFKESLIPLKKSSGGFSFTDILYNIPKYFFFK